jgi:hypothetical protein
MIKKVKVKEGDSLQTRLFWFIKKIILIKRILKYFSMIFLQEEKTLKDGLELIYYA